MEMMQNPNWPQFTIDAHSFEKTLEEVSNNKEQILYLVEEGQPLAEVELKLDEPIVAILGDDQGLSAAHEKVVLAKPIHKVSIGTRSLLGSQVVSLLLLDLKRRIEKQ
jgi:tRNA pseudouridine-54 N-methylase